MSFRQAIRTTRDYLFPAAVEREPGFRAEIERVSVRALRTIGWINLVMPATGIVVHAAAQALEPLDHRPVYFWSALLFFLLGGSTLLIARRRWASPHARLLTLVNGFLSGVLLIWINLFAGGAESAEITTLLNVVVILLVGVAIVPALPWHILLLGGALGWVHFVSAGLSARWGWTPKVSLHHYTGLDMVILLCCALAALNYRRLHETYSSHRGEIEAQERLLVSESAAMLVKFAATISHELNSPLGAVNSSLDSLERLEARRARGEADDSGRTRGLHETLVRTARASLDGMRQAIARMQRFTNLDRTEAHTVDVGQLLADVKALLQPEWEGRVELELACGELPRITVRPQQISAVLAKLLQNAIRVSPPHGTVELAARCQDGSVEVTVRDHGPGLLPDDLERAFEPGFQVRDGRVRAGHWGMFSSRQVVREHGGDLSIRSEPGRGVVITMTLPRESPLAPRVAG